MSEARTIQRYDYIDYLRAVGIILMVLAHIPLSDSFVHYVHGFHMPLFFVVSGFLFKGGGTAHLWKTAKKLLIPYFSFAVVAYLLWFVEIQPQSLMEALKPVMAVFWVNSEGMPLAGALWFLTAMLFVNVIVFGIETILGENKAKWIVVFGIFIFGLLETKILPFRLPWSTGAACVGVGYFYFGRLMKRGWNSNIMTKFRSIQAWIYCIILLFTGCSIMMNGILNMRKGEYACIPLSIINSFITVFALWLLVYRISPIVDSKLGHIANEIKRIGQYSVIWLCCNELTINVVWSVMDKMRFHNLVIEVLVVFISLKICEKLFTMTPLSVLVGFSYVKERR